MSVSVSVSASVSVSVSVLIILSKRYIVDVASHDDSLPLTYLYSCLYAWIGRTFLWTCIIVIVVLFKLPRSSPIVPSQCPFVNTRDEI